MKSSVEQQSATRVKLTVEVPFDELQPEIDQAYRSLAQQVTLPGFRKGKVPPRVLEARLGRGASLDQAINNMLPSRYSQAVEEHDLKVLTQPTIDITRLEDNELVEFTAEADVRPEIDLPDFSTIEVEVDPLVADDAAVDAELDNLRARFGTLKAVERPVQKDDFVSIDLSATVDGEPVDEATTEGLSHQVGNGELIEGLDDALEGMKVDESKTFKSNLVAGDHEGEEAEVTVTVKSLKERELPEADDDFAQLASEFDTIGELRESLAKQVEENKKAEQASSIRDKVLEKALEKTDFELPEAVVEEQVKGQLNQLLQQFNGDEKAFDQLLAAQGSSREEFDRDTRSSAEEAVRTQLFLDTLADELQPEVSQQEFTEHIMFTAQRYGMEPQQFMQAIQASDQIGALYADVRRGKALAESICTVSVKDTDGNEIDPKEYFGEEENTDETSTGSADAEASENSEATPSGTETEESAEFDQAAEAPVATPTDDDSENAEK